jgi:hypothetical protein
MFYPLFIPNYALEILKIFEHPILTFPKGKEKEQVLPLGRI